MLTGKLPPEEKHLQQVQTVAADRELADGVAACVDREQQARAGVVDQRVLRGEMVDHRPGELAAVAAGRVGGGRGQGAVASAVIGRHGVAGQPVALGKHRSRVGPAKGKRAVRACGRRTCGR